MLGLLLFLIYINDLPDGLSSNVKLFADDASLFSVVYVLCNSAGDLNKDLKTTNECAFQWKMGFNLIQISKLKKLYLQANSRICLILH